MTQSNPRPDRLGPRGAQLWDAIIGGYQLRPDEVILLEDASREVDLVDRLAAALVGAELISKGAYGQVIANPLVTEIRQHRGTLAALLRQLKLPDEPGHRGALTASEAARKAANARWRNGNDGA